MNLPSIKNFYLCNSATGGVGVAWRSDYRRVSGRREDLKGKGVSRDNITVREEIDANGQVAIITGASRGLGRAIALKLTEEGVNLPIIDGICRDWKK